MLNWELPHQVIEGSTHNRCDWSPYGKNSQHLLTFHHNGATSVRLSIEFADARREYCGKTQQAFVIFNPYLGLNLGLARHSRQTNKLVKEKLFRFRRTDLACILGAEKGKQSTTILVPGKKRCKVLPPHSLFQNRGSWRRDKGAPQQ